MATLPVRSKGLAKLTNDDREALLNQLRQLSGTSDRERTVVARVVDPILKVARLTTHGTGAVGQLAVLPRGVVLGLLGLISHVTFVP